MNKNYKYKRLNLAERNAIEQELLKKTSVRRIAAMLGRSVSSFTDEVKRNRVVVANKFATETWQF